jgi:hypothetical protein
LFWLYREALVNVKRAATSNSRGYCSYLLYQYPGKALKNCLFSNIFDSKTDSKTGGQQQILADFRGHRRGYLSLEWTLVDVKKRGVPKGGLEPQRPFEYNALNVACLPISMDS